MIKNDDRIKLKDSKQRIADVKRIVAQVKIANPPSGFKNKRNGENAERALIKTQEFLSKAVHQLDKII